VVGIRDSLKGQVPFGLVVLNDSCTRNPDHIEEEAINLIREKMGALACFKKAITVKGLPKTRSGKILRATIRSIGNGDKYAIPATCDSPEVLGEIENLIRQHEVLHH
jgi:propionyl-CoA synthetase